MNDPVPFVFGSLPSPAVPCGCCCQGGVALFVLQHLVFPGIILSDDELVSAVMLMPKGILEY
jgi:hypothetical protein